MSVPPLLLGAALAFWGWRSGNAAAAAAMALAVEASRALPWRVDFRHPEFSRVADACTVFFAGLLVFLFATTGEPRTARAVLTALLWLPAVLLPILLAQRFSVAGRIPLSALFRYLRRLKAREPSTPDPEIDLSGVYFALCIVAAGIPNRRDEGFYAGVVVLVAWGLAPLRPRHALTAVWAAMLIGAAGLGYAGHKGLSELQEAMEGWIGELMLRGFATDPYRATTDLGAVGRLKEIDTILLRVHAAPEEAERLRLLHRASYTTLAGSTWIARNAPLAPLAPEADGSTWRIAPGAPRERVRIVTRLENGKAVLSLPPATVRLAELPAASVRRNAYGATTADLGGDWAPYVAEFGGEEDYAPPRPEDLEIPERDRRAVRPFSALRSVPPAEAVEAVRRHFAAFTYATFREAPVPSGTTPLSDFLERSRAGHCEYFAGATTLALRAAGIPARYATGFAVVEHSALEDAYVVRARHAHAWARAYVAGRWVDVDTTPASWVAEEERRAPVWQGWLDFARWLSYRWSQRGALEGGAGWYALVAALALVLAWRVLRGKRASRRLVAAAPGRRWRGADSELYAALAKLEARFGRREAGETLESWVRRKHLPVAAELLALHYRHRFDPRGLSPAQREALRRGCLALARSLH